MAMKTEKYDMDVYEKISPSARFLKAALIIANELHAINSTLLKIKELKEHKE